jgi:hypothetical protein
MYCIRHSPRISCQTDETLIVLETSSRYTARRNVVPREMDAIQFEYQYNQCTLSTGRPSKQFFGRENMYSCYFL